MIPIRDTIPSKNYPVVNHTIIGINVVLYLFEMSQGADLNRFIYIYGLVPARYSVPQVAAYFSTGQQLFSLLSFMFLHGGFFHLLGNMWFLYIFGDNIEDRLTLFVTSLFTCFAELHPVFPISFSIFIPTCPPSEPAGPWRGSWGRI